MIIYNVTVKVDHSIHDEWLQWMKTKHIKDVINTRCFSDYKVCRLLEQDESEGMTYAIQYFCNDMEQYLYYQEHFAPALQAEHTEKYKNQFVAFRTIMEVVL